MLTLQQLGETLRQKQKHKEDFMFRADHYNVSVRFKEQIYIYIILESLSIYPRSERNLRLLHYVQQNTNILGYMSSTLAYTKSSDVIVQQYLDNLQEILDFANIVNNANVDNLDITIGANEAKNVFRKDEVEIFEDNEALFMNAPSEEQNMFKIPKVIN